MKIIAPDYYNKFSCIAEKCRHSCCIGWEIDIDEDTFLQYKSVGGNFGKRLMSSIAETDGSKYFVLTKEERCPFLNQDNLCDVILELGETGLCQICADHPRYRNFFSGRTEIGLGMCCEAAAELILTNKEKVKLIVLSNDDEDEQEDKDNEEFLLFRDGLFDIVQDRSRTMRERISRMLSVCDIRLPEISHSQWVSIYLELERLDESWTDDLNCLKNSELFSPAENSMPEWEIVFEQLLVYFLYRHTADGLYDGRLKARIAFCAYALYIIYLVCAAKDEINLKGFIDTARKYSSEIEYCEENLNKLLDIING